MIYYGLTSFAPDVSSLLAKRGANSGTISPMKKIQVGGHKNIANIRGYALVDDEDYEELNQYNWYAGNWVGGISAVRGIWVNGKMKHSSMHGMIMGTPSGMHTDHIDGDRLNNQKSNLRICTASQNAMNKGKPLDNTSGYKGVSWHKLQKSWIAKIVLNKKTVFLGYYEAPLDAAIAYNRAARKYHGAFAKLNPV